MKANSKMIAELQKKARAELEAQLAEKIEVLRNIDLASKAMADEHVKILTEKLDEKEMQNLEAEAADVADGYSEFLQHIANCLEDPKTRMGIIEELKRKL